MKRILYAADYSENGISAFQYAINLSEKLKAGLFALHVFNKDRAEPAEGQYQKLVDFCKEHYDGDLNKADINFDVVEDKSIINGIITKANKINAHLIITGSKSKTTVKKLLLGNTVESLIVKSPCPILTIPSSLEIKKINTIVYASDFEGKDLNAIYYLVKLVKPDHPAIRIVHISRRKEYKGDEQMRWFMELLEEKIAYPNIDAEVVFADNIFNSLKTYLAHKNADMLVMLERDSKGLMKKLFHDDLVKKMESLGNIPLLSFNENRL
jgi:nucleotide-binding universal stress UspA family protein